MAELDEFGIPKKSTTSQTMDEYGIPVKKKDSTVLSSSDGQSSLPLANEFERGQGLADNSFLKQIGKDAALSHAYPSGMVNVENPVDISLKEKAPKKDYYSTKLDKGLIFDKQGKLYAPSSEVLTTKIPKLKEEEITIKKTPQKDLVEQAREMPIEQPKVEEPSKEGEWGFDKAFKNTDNIFESLVSGDLTQANLVQNVAANFESAGTKMAKGATQLIRDASSGLSYITGQGKYPELFDENGKPTKYAESATWLNDPLGKVALGLQGNEKRMQSVISNNKLPDTFLGNAVSSVASFAPDLVATALLPEAKIAEGASIIKTIGSQLINNFTKYMTVKGGVEGYGEARSQGKGIGQASVEGLKGAGSGFENGVEMAVLGAGSNLATKGIMAKAEQIGLKGTAAHVTRELVNLGTDVTAYALLGPQAHAALEGKWITAKQIAEGTGVAALFRLKGAAENIKSNAELNEAIKQTQELKQGVAISNFVDADHAAIERVYYTKGTANDLQLDALDFAKKAKETSDLQKKAEYIAKAMTSARAANVKQVTEDILNNPDSLKKFEKSDLPDNIKQQFLQKADEIKKMLDPIEQQKTVLGQDIKDTTDFIKQSTDKMNAEPDPVKKAELEVRIEEANKYLEESNNELKSLIKEQIKPSEEADLTTDEGVKKAKKEFNKKIDEQIASLDKKSPDYENDLEALNKKKEQHNDHYDTLLKTKAPEKDEIIHPEVVGKKYIVDGKEVSQSEFEAMQGKPIGTKEVKPTEVKSVEERKQLLNQLENTFNLKDRVKGLIDNGIIDNSYSIDMGRPIVIANIGGIKVPFYRSLSGTGGKTVDKWYPFFGFGKNSAKDIDLDWFVKGTLDQNEKNYNSPAIAEYSKILNSVLNYPRSLDRSVKGNPFVDIGAKPIGEVNKIIYGNKDSGIVNDGKGGGQVAIKSFIDKVNKAYEAEVKPTEVKDVDFGTAFRMQDATAETTVGKNKDNWGDSQVWRERIENAGDILRELSSRGENPDVSYILEKVQKLKDWIERNKKYPSEKIPDEIKTTEDFKNSKLKNTNALDSYDYLNKFNSNILNKTKNEYKAIHTYTKEQRLARDLVIDLLNNNIEGLESKLNDIENIANKVKKEGKLEIIKDIKLANEPKNKQAEAKTASDLVSVSVAPYYDTQIADLSDASKLRESQGYKKHIEMLKKVAKSMGLSIESIDNTIGGFENDKGNKITEISNRVKLNTNDLDAAERYAAVVGALAHETQEATIAARYVEHGDPNQSAIETEIKVSDLKNAVNSLKEAGIHNFEVNENDNSIKILDFDNGKSDDFNNKMLSFADLLDKNNIQYETEHHAIESRYVDPERRSELLKEAKLQAEQQKGGTKLRNLYEKSTAKSEEFLNKKAVPPAEIPEEVHNSIVNRIKKGIQKLSDKAKVSVLSGKNFAKALDQAIKTGGANLQSWGGFEKKGFEESPEWQKLIDNGTVKLNFDIKGLEGKPVVVINPDNMLTGDIITKDGKTIVNGNGGINFVTKFGDVWASSDESTASTLANYINEARQKDIASGGDGTVHVVVSKGDLQKSLSSHTGSKAAMSVLEHMVDSKLISLSDFRKALTEVGKKYEIDFNGKLDAKAIHQDIASKFFGVKDSTFEQRGYFVQDIIDHLAENSQSVKDNIKKIREELNTNELPKSVENRKTGRIDFSKEGIMDAIGHLLSDNMTVGVKNSQAYATIEINHPVKPVDTRGKEGGHESYPWHIQQINEKGEKVAPKLNVLSNPQHITDILNDANNENVPRSIRSGKLNSKGKEIIESGAGKLGSNQIGMAKAYVKPAAEHPTGVNMMTDATGKIYGFEQNGKIVLNADLMNGNTPFHEAGHLWLSWAKENRSDLHDAGMAKIENSKYLKDVKNNEVYQENAAKLPESEREDYFKSEALAKAIGDNGEKFVNEAQKSDFKKWVKQLWETVATHFGLRDMSADDISKMTLDEFSQKVVGDIISPESQKIAKEEVTVEEKAPIEFSLEEAYNQLPKAKKLRENAQKTLINSNFDKIIEQLIKNDKIQKKC